MKLYFKNRDLENVILSDIEVENDSDNDSDIDENYDNILIESEEEKEDKKKIIVDKIEKCICITCDKKFDNKIDCIQHMQICYKEDIDRKNEEFKKAEILRKCDKICLKCDKKIEYYKFNDHCSVCNYDKTEKIDAEILKDMTDKSEKLKVILDIRDLIESRIKVLMNNKITIVNTSINIEKDKNNNVDITKITYLTHTFIIDILKPKYKFHHDVLVNYLKASSYGDSSYLKLFPYISNPKKGGNVFIREIIEFNGTSS
jgi:hypothetical protein